MGEDIELFGWVQIKREHGGVTFLDLRDRSGIVQLVFNEKYSIESFEKAAHLKPEYVIRASGEVRKRENPNPRIPTGYYEVWVKDFTLLNTSKTPPIGIIKQSDISEELRLRYRYIDLRRDEMRNNIIMRHRIVLSLRNYLNEMGFIDIETPFLTKSTPEGARDFLVPSRLNKGRFYALPQSPQIFKQLLMVSGFERYYQIVRCFRDEDLRADRQPEFTQIDIESSFIEENDIYILIEGMFKRVLEECYNKTFQTPLKRIGYNQAMERYGTDRPDLRNELKIVNINSFSELHPGGFIGSGLKNGKNLYGIITPASDKITRKVLDNLTQLSEKEGIGVFTWLKSSKMGLTGPMTKLFELDLKEKIDQVIVQQLEPDQGDYGENFFLLAGLGDKSTILTFMGRIRSDLAHTIDAIDHKRLELCWITDFPLFEWSNEENRLVSVHHPFTSPIETDMEILDKEPLKVKSRSYDFILNGVELGGGSIRIHNSDIQRKIFDILGLKPEEVKEKFGFLIDALDYGAPPHGGIAFGLDRIVMMLQGADSIREVIPFPKTTSGTCPLTGTPDRVSQGQLKELGIGIKNNTL